MFIKMDGGYFLVRQIRFIFLVFFKYRSQIQSNVLSKKKFRDTQSLVLSLSCETQRILTKNCHQWLPKLMCTRTRLQNHTEVGTSVLTNHKACFIYQMAQIHYAVLLPKNASKLQPSELQITIDWSFEVRNCIIFYLIWHRNQGGPILEATYLLNKKMYIQL